MGIIHALMRYGLDLFAPGTGRRRGATRPAVDTSDQVPEAPRAATSSLPAHRSPYGLDTPLDGAATVMVRPYLVADERERECARQSRRRLALVLAADFDIDLDRHVVGAGAVA